MPNEKRPKQAAWLERAVQGEFERPDLTGNLSIGWDGYAVDPSEPRTKLGIPLRALQAWAESEGLRLIGPAEVAVLEACAGALISEHEGTAWFSDLNNARPIAEAELARRRAGG